MLAETLVVFSRTVYFGSEIFPLAYFINICGENNYITFPHISRLVYFKGFTFLSVTFRNPEAYLSEKGGFHLSKTFSISRRVFLVQNDTRLCLVLVFSLLDFDVSEHSYEPLHTWNPTAVKPLLTWSFYVVSGLCSFTEALIALEKHRTCLFWSKNLYW